MINWNKSAELNDISVDALKLWFDKHPCSGRRIWRICDDCREEREVYFYAYRDLCKSCSVKKAHRNNPEAWNTDAVKLGYKKVSAATTKYFSDQKRRDEMSDKKKQYYIDHPEAIKRMSDRTIQYHIDHPEARESARLRSIAQWDDQSVRDEKSDQMIQYHIDHPEVIKRMIGGNDIVNHHWLYDDADLSKYTMSMTRSEHTFMHNRMRKDGYEVKHINSDTDDNGLWGYK